MHHPGASLQVNEEEIFQHAAGLVPTERPAYLSAACSGDPALRTRIERLLRLHEDREFMETSAERTVSSSMDSEFLRLKPEEVGERIANYKLLEQIGEGGFGVVWVAEQEKPMRRRVALKIIKLGMDTKEVIARFEQERQALAMMDHPNIAKVLDAGATPLGRPYFVMELVRGIKITEYCDQAHLPTEERLRLFIAVCQAVQHAHQKGIIHRDLKPSNILVTLHDGVPVPKVIDFGVAKATQQQRLTDLTVYTQFEQMIGTPLYMSPEQAEMTGLDIDTRSDIYSLGVLLYELLVGRTPFDPEELMKRGVDEIRRAVREQEPQKPSTFVSTMAVDLRTNLAQHRQTDGAKLLGQIRGDLDWIVMKALEKDRTRRYETANGLAQDIQRHLLSEPVQARPPTQLYRFRRFAKRNKVAFSAASAVLAALVIGLGVSTWMFIKEKQARQRAVAAEQEQVRLRKLAVAAEKAQSQERKKAETEAGKSRQVAKFLTDMLKGVGPSVALGRDTKMLREILDKTVERAGKGLKDQPAVEAELRRIIGNVYLELGEYEKAGALHGEALALRRKLFGNEHPDVSHSLDDLAKVLLAQGKLAEAETVHREALAMRRKLLGNEHSSVAMSLNNLATVLLTQGKLAEGETMLRESLAMQRQRLGNEHPGVANVLNNLATVLINQDKLAEAETMYREALAMQRKLLGNEHPDVASSLGNLAVVLRKQGNLAEAETMQREQLALSKKLLGDEHPDVATSLTNLAIVRSDQNKPVEAETMHREALAMQRKLLGNEHPDVAMSLNNLAAVLEKQGKLAEAETVHREALAMRRKLLGNEHPSVAMSLNNLADVLLTQGKLAEAETMLRESLAMQRKRLGNEHPRVATALENLARALDRQGKLAEAELMHREVLAIQVAIGRRSAINDAPGFEARIGLAENLYRQSKYSEAEPLYRETIESDKARPVEDANRVSTIASLARLLADWAWSDWAWSERTRSADLGPLRSDDGGAVKRTEVRAPHERAQEAERLLRDCLAIRLGGGLRGPNASPWRIDDVRSRLGGALLAVAVTEPNLGSEARLSKFAEAESLLLEGNEGLERITLPDDKKYQRDGLIRLVRLYEAWDKTDKVADWQQKLAEFDKAEAKKTEPEENAVSPKP